MKGCLFFVIIILISCGYENNPQPRPHQYPRIAFDDHKYISYAEKECPFTVNIPTSAEVKKKKLLFGEILADPCWFDIEMKKLGATIHCSYFPIGKDFELDKLVNDAFSMASKHNVKATYKEEFLIRNRNGSGGLIIKINGPVATPYQFYLTDSTDHFLRGSLYFNERVNMDSVAPIIGYIEKDIEEMLNSIKWN